MTPHLRITVKEPVWPYLWVKFVRGFDPRRCCARCLAGRYWDRIPFRRHAAGAVFAGPLAFSEPVVYVCGVHRRGYDFNLHLPCERNPRSRWAVETAEIRVEAAGIKRLLPIPPLPPEVVPWVTRRQAACRCYRLGARLWPDRLADLLGPTLFDGLK